jgi:hypothetical protein
MMSSHPINLTVRFLLELAVLLAVGIWGWQQGAGWLSFALAVGLPVGAALVWGTFRVPNDPGPAPVAVPGLVRLVFELALFTFATWALYQVGFVTFAWIFGVVAAVHYLTSYDRILWLLKQ